MAKSPSEQIRELVAELKILAERDENRRRDVERLTRKSEDLPAELALLRQENAVLRQRLDDHLKRVETWSARLWALVSVLIGAVLSLASGLIVTLVRK